MQHISRILVALTILLSGAALVPFVDVPAETFEWQRYAGGYGDPEIAVNYFDGQPGSYFHFSGIGFSPNGTPEVSANGNPLGNVTTDETGNLEFNINSANADLGSYYITVMQGNTSLTLKIVVWAEAPLRALEGGGEIFNLAAGTGITELSLPIIVK